MAFLQSDVLLWVGKLWAYCRRDPQLVISGQCSWGFSFSHATVRKSRFYWFQARTTDENNSGFIANENLFKLILLLHIYFTLVFARPAPCWKLIFLHFWRATESRRRKARSGLHAAAKKKVLRLVITQNTKEHFSNSIFRVAHSTRSTCRLFLGFMFSHTFRLGI